MTLYHNGDDALPQWRWCFTTMAMMLYRIGDDALSGRLWWFTTMAI